MSHSTYISLTVPIFALSPGAAVFGWSRRHQTARTIKSSPNGRGLSGLWIDR
jgi:hypothetical protein